MAQRTVMRVSLADMKAMMVGSEDHSTASPPPAAPQSSNTIYFVTLRMLHADGLNRNFGIVSGPRRSRIDAVEDLLARFPRANSFLAGHKDTEFAHLTWKEDNGDEVMVQIDKEVNAAVCACSYDRDVYTIIHHHAWFNAHDNLMSNEDIGPAGTYLDLQAANNAAVSLIRDDIKDKEVPPSRGGYNDDGTVTVMAKTEGRGGQIWSVEIAKLRW